MMLGINKVTIALYLKNTMLTFVFILVINLSPHGGSFTFVGPIHLLVSYKPDFFCTFTYYTQLLLLSRHYY